MIEKTYVVGGTTLLPAVVLTDAAGNAVAGPTTMYHYVATASTNAVRITPNPGRVWAINALNTTAGAKYLKMYNKTGVPSPAGDTPIKTFQIPPKGSVVWNPGIGSPFTNGIGFAIVAGAGDLDATAVAAGDVILDVDWA